MSNIATALQVATEAHLGQLDKGGEHYIYHPIRVANYCQQAGLSDEHVIVALLHDVVEDTPVTLEDLWNHGFSEEVIAAVDAITQRKKEHRDSYYARVVANPIAKAVKWWDVEDNASPARMAQLSPETQERLGAKYVKARAILGG